MMNELRIFLVFTQFFQKNQLIERTGKLHTYNL